MALPKHPTLLQVGSPSSVTVCMKYWSLSFRLSATINPLVCLECPTRPKYVNQKKSHEQSMRGLRVSSREIQGMHFAYLHMPLGQRKLPVSLPSYPTWVR
jgi:hypothetical protein